MPSRRGAFSRSIMSSRTWRRARRPSVCRDRRRMDCARGAAAIQGNCRTRLRERSGARVIKQAVAESDHGYRIPVRPAGLCCSVRHAGVPAELEIAGGFHGRGRRAARGKRRRLVARNGRIGGVGIAGSDRRGMVCRRAGLCIPACIEAKAALAVARRGYRGGVFPGAAARLHGAKCAQPDAQRQDGTAAVAARNASLSPRPRLTTSLDRQRGTFTITSRRSAGA